MPGSDDRTIPPPPSLNAFSSDFLQRLGEHDEPVTAGEAEVAGPWRVEPIPGAGFGVYRAGEGAGRGFRPVAVFRQRSVALLAASVLPGTGRERAFLLQREEDPAGGYAVQDGSEVAGHLGHFDERLIEALHVVESVVRSPEALAFLLEAAGSLALDRAGTILAGRVS